MRIVVVGAGKVGRVLTEQLAAEKHDIVVIDQDSDLIESIVNIYDVRGVAGNGGCYDIQKDAFECMAPTCSSPPPPATRPIFWPALSQKSSVHRTLSAPYP